MENNNHPLIIPRSKWINQTAVYRFLWLINLLLAIALFTLGHLALFGQGTAEFADIIKNMSVNAVLPSFFTERIPSTLFIYQMLIQVIIFLLVGLFIFWQQPSNFMAILTSAMLINIGLGFTPNLFFLPFVRPNWTFPYILWQVYLYITGFLFIYLFPNGRFTATRARWLATLSVGYILLWLFFHELTPGLATSWWPIYAVILLSFVGVGNQVIRYRYSNNQERVRTKWVIVGFFFAHFGLVLLIFQPFLFGELPITSQNSVAYIYHALNLLFGLAAVCIPLTIAIALLRYDLWNVDFILNRTLVYGGLTAVIIITYALLVGSLSLLWRSQNNLLISLLATGLIAVLFQPMRERLQRAVNRLIFGDRDDPYAVLSKLGAQLQTTTTPEAMLQSVVETVTATLKLPYAAIELTDEQGRLNGASIGTAVAKTVEFPLRYQNETVGFLIASPRSPDESFTKQEHQLLQDMAGQTGAMAYAVRLTAVLKRSAADLQQSREKLVLAREEERRRIRRDLHDELGPTLASQTFALDAVLDTLEHDPETASHLLHALKKQNQATVAEIRRLVYGLRPPTLDELGIVGALQTYVTKLDGRFLPLIQIIVNPDPLPPLSAAVEVAAYRIALEAITNVVRHAQAQHCQVLLRLDENGRFNTLNTTRSQLRVEIIDDGTGLPPQPTAGVGLSSMRQRAEELGGFLTVVNEKDGVRLTAVLPL